MFNKNQIYCPQRKNWIVSTPEEIVRQQLLSTLINQLGFPKEHIVVEKELKFLPHLQNQVIPERRADVICYTKRQESLHPLLLIECKAIVLTEKEMRQVVGYNHFVKASFIGLINQNEMKLGWYNPQLNDYQFVNYFPSYSQLIASLV